MTHPQQQPYYVSTARSPRPARWSRGDPGNMRARRLQRPPSKESAQNFRMLRDDALVLYIIGLALGARVQARCRYRTMDAVAGSCARGGHVRLLHKKTSARQAVKPMKIAVFGLGYVGVVSAACLARDGHSVVGVDPNNVKVDFLRRGESPIVEPGLGELIAAAVAGGRLVAGSDYVTAVAHCEVLIMCVGTPGQANGSLDLTYVRRVVLADRRAAARRAAAIEVVVIRSTLLPGSMQGVVIPVLEESSRPQGRKGFRRVHQPGIPARRYRDLRLRSSAEDGNRRLGRACRRRRARAVTRSWSAPLVVTDLRTAEMVKYVDNSWHALKVTFANEVGRLSKAMGIDARQVMRLFCMDTKLNVSSAYLRPGFAFGGSCLPKDVRALTYQGRLLDVDTPVLGSILASNQLHIAHALIDDPGDRSATRGAARPELQGRHGRPARESDRHARGAAHRQGLRASRLRPERQAGEPAGSQSRIHSESHPSYRAAHGGSARNSSSSTPTCWSSPPRARN